MLRIRHSMRSGSLRPDGGSIRPKAAGFSIIELVIAVVLIGLLLAMGLPAFTTALANMRVRQVSESVRDGLQTARNEAVKRNTAVAFNLDNATGGGWSVTLVADGTLLRSKSASEGASIFVDSGGAPEVDFSNLGLMTLPAAASQTFAVSNPNIGACGPGGNIRCLSVVVSAGGQVRLCDPQRINPDPQAC